MFKIRNSIKLMLVLGIMYLPAALVCAQESTSGVVTSPFRYSKAPVTNYALLSMIEVERGYPRAGTGYASKRFHADKGESIVQSVNETRNNAVWRSTWAHIVYGLLLMIALVSADIYQRKRLIAKERLRAERDKAHAIASTNLELEQALHHLTETKNQLVHAEKMASLGQLTAGIAHEIKNPLNFVNNFSRLSEQVIDELKEWIEEKGGMEDPDVKDLVDTLKMNATKINEHGMRADGIITAMLEHARAEKSVSKSVDINRFAGDYLNLAYNGARARNDALAINLERAYDTAIGEVEIYPDDMGRVLINLLDNAFYAVIEKSKVQEAQGLPYEPQVSVATRRMDENVEIRIKDNGPGISKEIQHKIFEPFFTTKPTGKGTGLGLSLSHDIVVTEHKGQLTVQSENGKGAEFIINIPIRR